MTEPKIEVPEEKIWLAKQRAPARVGPTGSTCSTSWQRSTKLR